MMAKLSLVLSRQVFFVVLAVSMVLLFSPAQEGPLPFEHFDKLVHLGLFGLLALTASWHWESQKGVMVAMVLYAWLSEVVQGLWVAGRQFDVADLAVDLVAICLVQVWLYSANRSNGIQGVGRR